MSTTFSLLRIVSKAVAKHALNAVAFGAPLGDILFEAAEEAMRRWKDQSQDDERQAELHAMAYATGPEINKQIGEIVHTEFADLPQQTQEEVASYLMQITSNYRRKCTSLAGSGGVGL